MKDILADIKSRASALNKTVVLPEGEDKRVVEAAFKTVDEGVAKIILLGNPDEIKANNPDVCLDKVTIIDPVTYDKTDKYAEMLFNIRQGKINKKTGAPEYATVEDAKNYILKDYTMYGALMLKADDVDGMVSGACHSTANTLRPGLQVIKTAPGEKMVSAYFLMIAPACGNKYCEDGCYIYADSGLVQNPTSEELAYIALSSAKSCEQVANIEPRIAFISHSSKGSAKHADVTKVTDAVKLFKEIAPQYKADGELQFDAAIVPDVAKSKAPGSEVAGHANVMIFPDLDAGNSNYKNTERLGGFMAIGPICQGLAKPINDLSRGCHTDDIVAAVAITALQTQK
ncbi:MAG: phosphate acetyltransferase [Clostridiales bacterium]|nr:phosphate acetyltransferase [Clostridiales bacterium]